MMKDLVEQLIAVLVAEEQILSEFAALLDQEKGILVSFATGLLLDNNNAKTECVARINLLEDRRLSIVDEIARVLHADSGSFKISDLKKKIDPDLARRLEAIKGSVTSILATVRAKINDNAEYIGISEANATMALDFYRSIFKISSTYGKKGVSSYNPRNAGFVSSKA